MSDEKFLGSEAYRLWMLAYERAERKRAWACHKMAVGWYNYREERQKVRAMHRTRYLKLKKCVASDSVIHHEWIPKTADYRGVALVEADQHRHGIIDVIQILEGEITLLREL